MKGKAILAVNAGSSSVKAALFQDDLRQDFHYASIGRGEFPDHASAFKKLIEDLQGQTIHAVGHRITHGGDVPEPARIIDDEEQARLQITREPYSLPQLVIQRKPASIFDYVYEDFAIVNYQSHPHIAAPIAV